jgi:hypothetical protein
MLLRDALKGAIMRPPLKREFPKMVSYFETQDQMIKRPFLDALKKSGMVWDDCVGYAVATNEVQGLLRNDVFSKAMASRLATIGFERMIFMSRTQEKLSDDLRHKLIEQGKWRSKAISVFRMNFWDRARGEAEKKQAQEARSGEIANALKKPLSSRSVRE